MGEKDTLSEEDHLLFHNAMRDVTPLSSTDTQKKPTDVKPTIKEKTATQSSTVTKALSQKITSAPASLDASARYRRMLAQQPLQTETTHSAIIKEVDSNDIISFSRDGISVRELRKLRQGHIPINATLDLHQLNQQQAFERSQSFIYACQSKNIRYAIIIHGKSSYSTQKPILKNALNRWLRHNDAVLAFHSAKPQHGGNGAVYVLIKKKHLRQ